MAGADPQRGSGRTRAGSGRRSCRGADVSARLPGPARARADHRRPHRDVLGRADSRRPRGVVHVSDRPPDRWADRRRDRRRAARGQPRVSLPGRPADVGRACRRCLGRRARGRVAISRFQTGAPVRSRDRRGAVHPAQSCAAGTRDGRDGFVRECLRGSKPEPRYEGPPTDRVRPRRPAVCRRAPDAAERDLRRAVHVGLWRGATPLLRRSHRPESLALPDLAGRDADAGGTDRAGGALGAAAPWHGAPRVVAARVRARDVWLLSAVRRVRRLVVSAFSLAGVAADARADGGRADSSRCSRVSGRSGCARASTVTLGASSPFSSSPPSGERCFGCTSSSAGIGTAASTSRAGFRRTPLF